MILIDYSQVAIANIVIAFKRDGEVPNPTTARHMILNTIRGYVHTYRQEYGPEVVIAVDYEDAKRVAAARNPGAQIVSVTAVF